MSAFSVTRKPDATPAMPPNPIEGPAAWRGADMARSDAWMHRLSGRPLPHWFAGRWGSNEVGNRGCIIVPGARPNAPLQPA